MSDRTTLIQLNFFSVFLLPAIMTFLTKSILEERPKENCEHQMERKIQFCLSDSSKEPKKLHDNDVISLSSNQQRLADSGANLDQLGLDPKQKDELRRYCIRDSYFKIKMLPQCQ
jgi:hypothetical protein